MNSIRCKWVFAVLPLFIALFAFASMMFLPVDSKAQGNADLSEAPHEDENYEQTASDYFDEEDFESAAKYYSLAIEQDPDNEILYYNLALCYEAFDECKASEQYEIYLELSGEQDDAQDILQRIESIKLQCERGQNDNDESPLSQEQSDHFKQIADEYFNKKDYKNAVNNYSKALEMDPDNGELHKQIALSYAQQEEFCKAAPHLNRYSELSDKPETDDRIKKLMNGIDFLCEQSAESNKWCGVETVESDFSGRENINEDLKPVNRSFLWTLESGLKSINDVEGNPVFLESHPCYFAKGRISRTAFSINNHPDYVFMVSFDPEKSYLVSNPCVSGRCKIEYMFWIGILKDGHLIQKAITGTAPFSGSVFSSDKDWDPVFKAMFKVFEQTGINVTIDTKDFHIRND